MGLQHLPPAPSFSILSLFSLLFPFLFFLSYTLRNSVAVQLVIVFPSLARWA
jgi:hypothetical protein